MKVLVVDDVGYSRHYHSRLLEKFGFEVETAESGLQALKTLERDMTINAVLTDLIMREMDGVELYKRSLRISRIVDGGSAEPPAFILMTALRPGKQNQHDKDVEKIRTAKLIGFMEVLYKPIEPEILKNTLDALKDARGRSLIDTATTLKHVKETIHSLIEANQLDDASRFLDELRNELERLDQFVSQPAEN